MIFPWLRTNLVPILVGLSVLMAVGAVRGWTLAAHFEGVAETHRELANAKQSSVDSLTRANAEIRQRTADLADTYTADSIRWAEEARESALRIASLSASAERTAQSLRERLDSVGTALLDTYEAEVDSIMAIKNAQIASLENERASLWEQRESMASLIQGLQAEADGLRAVNRSLRAANEALRRANKSGGIFPDFGDLTTPVYIAIGAAIGWGGAKLTTAR